MLSEPEAWDRAAVIELFTSPEVRTYFGGPRPRDEFERAVPEGEGPRRSAGFFVVDLDGAMIGMVTFDRRDAERPGHVRSDAGEVELSYMFLPEMCVWVCRRGVRGGTRLVRWRASRRAGGAVHTTANDRSMRLAARLGFTEVERFEEHGAEQWFGVWSSVTQSG